MNSSSILAPNRPPRRSAHTTTRHARTILLALFVALCLLLSTVAPAQPLLAQGDPPAFVCSDGTAFLFQRNPTDVFTVDLITGAANEVASDIAPAGSPINGIGFNQTDGYIWGSVENPSGSGRIARVGADYVPQYFDIPGLPARSYNAGDVSADGLLHLYNDGVGTTIYVIDVNPNRPATYLTVTTLTTTKANGTIVDLAFSPIDGNIYAISSATNTSNLQLHRFDSTTGVRTNLGDVTGGDINATPSSFGAVYFAADGNFYVSSNATGRIYRIERPDLLTRAAASRLPSSPQGPHPTSTTALAVAWPRCRMPRRLPPTTTSPPRWARS